MDVAMSGAKAKALAGLRYTKWWSVDVLEVLGFVWVSGIL